jgi:hypothetical protein
LKSLNRVTTFFGNIVKNRVNVFRNIDKNAILQALKLNGDGDLQTSKLNLLVPARTSFDVSNSNEFYRAHELLSRIRHRIIRNIILSVSVLYKYSFEKSEMQDK